MTVSHPRIESSAFQQALLKSERLRILIVLGTIAVALLLRTIRTVVAGGSENISSWFITFELLALFAIYESAMLIAVNRSLRKGKDLSNSVWVTNIVVETFLPALGLVLIRSSSIDVAYRPLANPAVLAFFLFIILSVLRLNPALCRLSGLVAATSYLVGAAYLGWRPPFGEASSLLSPQKAVIGYALALVVSGFVAGVVAGEVRKQVDAALREAETRRQVERLEHDLEIARSIQQSLLPSSAPQLEGFEIAGWNKPADQTGGDYYDWQCLPDGKLVIALADVTGHGIGPAMLAAVCRAYARASFRGCGALMATMEQINALLAGDIGEGRFVTFVMVVCTPRSSQVELLSAGHGPLFLYALKEDRFDEMGAQGLPLGIVADLVSEPPHALNLGSGDLLVLATDGFFEWANPQNELFGPMRLEQAIRTSRAKHPSEIISDLYQAVIEFSGGTKQQDDLTAVIIKRK
ncbi:MAG TPA: PP2C family protein-serine/threonine phosphatase [Candidatus Sulfotelmatobacter sp.]|jgi:serine phosphatase RsbU (regulator of sigma subunit)|nr:PP2C family protein-serine/threonine phosphatase [Candidatus Sulfotelmatobacter sp.]